MSMFKIVETDNFGRDDPNERFLNLPALHKDHAERIVQAINSGLPPQSPRAWVVKPADYVLKPGFQA